MFQNVPCSMLHLSWKFHENPHTKCLIEILANPIEWNTDSTLIQNGCGWMNPHTIISQDIIKPYKPIKTCEDDQVTLQLKKKLTMQYLVGIFNLDLHHLKQCKPLHPIIQSNEKNKKHAIQRRSCMPMPAKQIHTKLTMIFVRPVSENPKTKWRNTWNTL